MQPDHKNQNKIEILTSILDWYPKLYSLDLKNFGNILAKIILLKVSMHSKEMECYSINGKQTIYIKGVLKYKKN